MSWYVNPRLPAEQIEAGPVTLRRKRVTDAPALVPVVTESYEHLLPWMPWATPNYDLAQATQYLSRAEQEWEDGIGFDYTIEAGGQVVGSIGLMARIDPGGLEIGYWLHPEYTGRGLATLAVGALTEEAFRVGADHVEIHHDAANVASGRIPARLGFVEVERRERGAEAVPPGGNGILVIWRITRS